MIIQTDRYDSLSQAESDKKDFEIINPTPSGCVWKTYPIFTPQEEDFFRKYPYKRMGIYKKILKEHITHLKNVGFI